MGARPPLLAQVSTDLFREAEVGGVVAVKVTDLPTTKIEGKLAAAARTCRDTGPGGDFCIGVHFSGHWMDDRARRYIARVKRRLREKDWIAWGYPAKR